MAYKTATAAIFPLKIIATNEKIQISLLVKHFTVGQYTNYNFQ